MAKKKSTTDKNEPIDAKELSFEAIFEIVVSNFGHVQENQILELYELLKTQKK